MLRLNQTDQRSVVRAMKYCGWIGAISSQFERNTDETWIDQINKRKLDVGRHVKAAKWSTPEETIRTQKKEKWTTTAEGAAKTEKDPQREEKRERERERGKKRDL